MMDLRKTDISDWDCWKGSYCESLEMILANKSCSGVSCSQCIFSDANNGNQYLCRDRDFKKTITDTVEQHLRKEFLNNDIVQDAIDLLCKLNYKVEKQLLTMNQVIAKYKQKELDFSDDEKYVVYWEEKEASDGTWSFRKITKTNHLYSVGQFVYDKYVAEKLANELNENKIKI